MSEQQPGTDLIRSTSELDRYVRIGQWLAASETDGPASAAPTAALRLYFAEQLGLTPMAASELSVIKGRLFMQAKLLRAMAATRGYRVGRTDDSNDVRCTAILYDTDGDEVGRYTFTLEDAKRAGLIRQGSAWQTHPARMLWARASKYVLDDYAPEVTLGISTFDELADQRQQPAGAGPAAEDIPWPEAEEGDWEPVPTEEQQQAADDKAHQDADDPAETTA